MARVWLVYLVKMLFSIAMLAYQRLVPIVSPLQGGLVANLPLSPAQLEGPVCKTFYADPELRMRTRATELQTTTGLNMMIVIFDRDENIRKHDSQVDEMY